jgi:hypothetical protein
MDCAYCEAGIAEVHTHQAHVCLECGDEVQAVDNQGRCVSCITMAHMSVLINKIELGAK